MTKSANRLVIKLFLLSALALAVVSTPSSEDRALAYNICGDYCSFAGGLHCGHSNADLGHGGCTIRIDGLGCNYSFYCAGPTR
jgi:hypothetical protein